MFSPEGLAEETDGVVSDFLDLLGWRHDRTGPKGKPFHNSFDVLGMTLELGQQQTHGTVVVRKKSGRVDKIIQKVASIRKAGVLPLAEAQELRGLLNFATGYFAGRFLKYACFKIFLLVDQGSHNRSRLERWCDDVTALLESVQPRTIPVALNTRTILSCLHRWILGERCCRNWSSHRR